MHAEVGLVCGLRVFGGDQWQHRGYGVKLLAAAENLARENGFGRVAVTSGIGVREYYRRHGYARCGAYMVKRF